MELFGDLVLAITALESRGGGSPRVSATILVKRKGRDGRVESRGVGKCETREIVLFGDGVLQLVVEGREP